LGVVCEDIAAVLRDGRVLVAVDAAVQSKRQSGASGATASWIEGFIGDVQSARLVVAMRLSVWRQEPADRGAITRVLEAARTLARGVAGRLAGWPSRSSLAAALAELEAAGCACEAPAVRTLAASLHASFAATVARLDEPWPIGRRASPVERPPSGAGVVASLRQHLRWGDIQVRHALKLGLTYTVATVLALGPLNVMLDRHGFWIPLTVAWVCRPDVAGSVTRFSLRLCGTVFGVLLGATLLQVITDPVGRMLVTALGACGMAAFLFANYALAVGGVTVLVLSLAGVMGGYTQELAEARLIATLLGCGLVWLSAYVVAVRSGTAVPMHLQRMSSHLRQLMASVRAEAVGAIRNPIRAAMRRDRLAAAAALAAADAEPRAPWEGRAVGMELKALRAVLEQLDGWAERIAYIDLVERGQVSEEEWQALGGALDALDRDLLKSVQA
jgi:uncharacterized membrane protein YccC